MNGMTSPIDQLNNQARPRPDIGIEGRPYTFMGRVATQPTSIAELMNKTPAGELESAGQAMQALPGLAAAGMAKQFIPAKGPQSIAQLARAGSSPLTELEKMWPAVIDAKTGEVLHAMAPTGAGGHKSLYEAASAMKDFQPTRGFVDPQTFKAYTEAMLEDALQRKHFGR